MLTRRVHLPTQRAASSQMRPCRTVAPWRVWIALLTTLAFAVLLVAGGTHRHATAAEDHACAVCGVVNHGLADAPLAAMPTRTEFLFGYAPFLLPAPLAARIFPILCPPSCGPPEHKALIY